MSADIITRALVSACWVIIAGLSIYIWFLLGEERIRRRLAGWLLKLSIAIHPTYDGRARSGRREGGDV